LATGQNIADEARRDFNDGDATNLRWSDAEMLRYINAAQRRIVTLVPEANVVETAVTISDGDVRQSLPAGGIKFLGLANYDNTNSVRGAAVTQVELDALTTMSPEWSYVTAYPTHLVWPDMATEHTEFIVEHFAHDPRDPKVYYVFPTRDTDFYVYLTYSAIPTALATLASTFALGDEYLNAAVHYVKYRMAWKDFRYAPGRERRDQEYQLFLAALGLKLEADRRVDPAVHRPPMDEHG
jgi:hypothetical protein